MIFVVWLIFAIVVGIAASGRGRSGFGWFLLAAFFSPLIAGVLLALLPSRLPLTPVAPTYPTRPCPFCAEPIRLQAKLCPHCRSPLLASSSSLSTGGAQIGMDMAKISEPSSPLSRAGAQTGVHTAKISEPSSSLSTGGAHTGALVVFGAVVIAIIIIGATLPIRTKSASSVPNPPVPPKDNSRLDPVNTAAISPPPQKPARSTASSTVIADLLAQRAQCKESLKNLETVGTVTEVKADNGNVWAYYDETAWNSLAPDDRKSAGFTIFCATMPTSGKHVVVLQGMHEGKSLGKIVNGNWSDSTSLPIKNTESIQPGANEVVSSNGRCTRDQYERDKAYIQLAFRSGMLANPPQDGRLYL